MSSLMTEEDNVVENITAEHEGTAMDVNNVDREKEVKKEVSPQQTRKNKRSCKSIKRKHWKEKIKTLSPEATAVNPVISCALCATTFSSEIYLADHQRHCRGYKSNPEVVEVGKIPTDIQLLAQVIDGRKVFCCHVCSYQTVRGGHMTRHLLSHMGARPYRCEECSKSFTQSEGLRLHKLTHVSIKPYSCGHCNFSCKRPSGLKRHLATHSGEVMFACALCDYKTSQKYNLKVHTMIHSEVKPFKCGQCDYSAIFRSSVVKHERTAHSTDKPHKCAKCPRTFKVPEALTLHMRRRHKALS